MLVQKDLILTNKGKCLKRALNSIQRCFIPSTVQVISSNAFRNCTLLTEIDIPDNVRTIGRNAFKACKSLIKVHTNLHASKLNHIGRHAFSGCESLISIVLPLRLKRIETKAFLNCTNLKDIYVRPTVEHIGTDAFRGCVNLPSKCSCTHEEILKLWIFGTEARLKRRLGSRVYQVISTFLPMNRHVNILQDKGNVTVNNTDGCVVA